MPQKTKHRGFEIEIDEAPARGRGARPPRASGIDGALRAVKIDKKRIDVVKDEDGRFSTSQLPYTTYGSAVELSKAVVDDSPDFDTTSAKKKAATKKTTARKRK